MQSVVALKLTSGGGGGRAFDRVWFGRDVEFVLDKREMDKIYVLVRMVEEKGCVCCENSWNQFQSTLSLFMSVHLYSRSEWDVVVVVVVVVVSSSGQE